MHPSPQQRAEHGEPLRRDPAPRHNCRPSILARSTASNRSAATGSQRRAPPGRVPAYPTCFTYALLAVAPSNAPPRQPGTTQRFVPTDATEESVHFAAPGAELRLVAPDHSVVHQRRFFSSASGRFDFRALRKKDGTAVLLFVSPDSTGLAPTALVSRWTFKGGTGDEDLRLRRGGSETPEIATLEFVLDPAP